MIYRTRNGVNGADLDKTRLSRRMTQGQLAQMLAPFNIRPRTIWPLQRMQNSKSRKGYLRQQFERAWAAYCDARVHTGTTPASQTFRG